MHTYIPQEFVEFEELIDYKDLSEMHNYGLNFYEIEGPGFFQS